MKDLRRYPIGAEIIPNEGVHFRVWAPDHSRLQLAIENEKEKATFFPLVNEKNGYFSVLIPTAKKGTLYRYHGSKSEGLLADPASRFQPAGPLGPSEVVDPTYQWTDHNWFGVELEGQVIYEMHIGTFTPEGTFQSAINQLEELADLGITVLEIMPLNDFPGDFGWGYDGVNLFAPTRLYGKPQDLKAFVNKAHSLGLGIILDVVYNHLGPKGNFLPSFANEYFTDKHKTDWGKAINFDSIPVCEFFLTNARYWIEEYHFDGLRLDATSCIFSAAKKHILAELTKTVRIAAGERKTFIVAENEPQNIKLVRPYDQQGYGLDALWNDDYHHIASVKLTGKREAYFTDYLGTPQEFISSLKYGFLYQGQYYTWQKKHRGTPELNFSPLSLVTFLENHDQIPNSLSGKRLHQMSDPGNFKSLTCLLLLGPNTPMLFQGQEFYSSKPFYYFSDHDEELKELIYKGRKKELSQFPSFATSEFQETIPNPSKVENFIKCKLDFNERKINSWQYKMHKDLLKLRRKDPVFKSPSKYTIDGAVMSSDVFLIRFFSTEGHRLIIINFGADHTFLISSEPLLVAGQSLEWELLWSSESIIYSGQGTPPINIPIWTIAGHSAIVLKTKSHKNLSKKNETDH